MSLRRFFRLLLDKNWRPSVPTVDDSLAKTAMDALDIRGRTGSGGLRGCLAGSQACSHLVGNRAQHGDSRPYPGRVRPVAGRSVPQSQSRSQAEGSSAAATRQRRPG